MGLYKNPVTLSDDGKRYEVMPEGRKLEPAVLPVSEVGDNLIKQRQDGLAVRAAHLVSKVEPNSLELQADNRLYVAAKKLVADDEKVLFAADNKLSTILKLSFNEDTGELKLRGINEVPVTTVVLPTAPGLPVVAEILENYTPPADDIGNNRPTGTYLHLRFKLSGGLFKDIFYDVTKLVDVYQGGNGISIENNTVSVKLSKATKALAFDGDGALWVKAEELLSKAADNGLSAVDGGLFAQKLPGLGAGLMLENGQMMVKLADVQHPALAMSKDGGLVLKLNPLISPNEGNRLVVLDGQFYAASYKAGDGLELADGAFALKISPEDMQVLAIAKDGGLTLKLHPMISPAEGNKLSIRDGKLYVDDSDLDTTYTAGNGLSLEGTEFSVKISPDDMQALAIAKDGGLTLKLTPMVSEDTNNKLSIKDGRLYVDNGDLDTTYTAGEGLSLEDTVFAVKLSADTHALAFSETDKGLVVLAENLIAPAEGNALRIEDNHLFVPTAISKDTVAAPLYIDGKGKLAINKSQLVDPNGPIIVDPKTGKLTIDKGKLEALGVSGGVSADEGNNLKAGSDGKPYYPSDLGNL